MSRSFAALVLVTVYSAQPGLSLRHGESPAQATQQLAPEQCHPTTSAHQCPAKSSRSGERVSRRARKQQDGAKDVEKIYQYPVHSGQLLGQVTQITPKQQGNVDNKEKVKRTSQILWTIWQGATITHLTIRSRRDSSRSKRHGPRASRASISAYRHSAKHQSIRTGRGPHGHLFQLIGTRQVN